MTVRETRQKIRKVAEKIAKEHKPERIILFGSYAWGKPNKDSDIDLFIVKKTKNTRTAAIKINGSIYPRLFAVDVLVYTPAELKKSINENRNLFIEDIARNGKVLYEKSGDMFGVVFPKRPLNILH